MYKHFSTENGLFLILVPRQKRRNPCRTYRYQYDCWLGTAADLIMVAMNNIHAKLKKVSMGQR